VKRGAEIPEAEFDVLDRIRILREQLKETEFMTIQSLLQQGYSMSMIAIPMRMTKQALRGRLVKGYYGEVVDVAPQESFEDVLASVMEERT
jgi:hypothetical protein